MTLDVCRVVTLEEAARQALGALEAAGYGRSYAAIDLREALGITENYEVPKACEALRACSVCGSTHNVVYMGGSIPYLCDSPECIPF